MLGWIQTTSKQSLQGCVEEYGIISLNILLLHFLSYGYFVESLKSATVSWPLLFYYFILFCHMVCDDCYETSPKLQCHIIIVYVSPRVVFVSVVPVPTSAVEDIES